MNKTLIIAEAGNNHEGSALTAFELLNKAKDCGCDLVKFQAGIAEGFAREAKDYERYKKYELKDEGYQQILEEGYKIGMPVFFSVWSDWKDETENWLEKYRRLEWFKIASRQMFDQRNYKYITEKTIISIPHNEVLNYDTIDKIKKGILLHCVSEYPAIKPMFNRLEDIKEHYDIDLGFSDHSIGIETAFEAVVKHGCRVIEKHFTLDHNTEGLRDHRLSANPREMSTLVEAVRIYDQERLKNGS